MTVKEQIRALALEAGASAVGFARVEPVEQSAMARYDEWIAAGCHADMDYMARNRHLRLNPEGLLEGARTVIALAFNYLPSRLRPAGLPRFARYSYGLDYHDVLRRRVGDLGHAIAGQWGGEWRVCVDTAPVSERYWAVQAGLGFIGRNSQLIIPGHGSYHFIALLLTTLDLEPDLPMVEARCPEGCRCCIDACPGHAITKASTIDSRRCLSYLTIEQRGPLPEQVKLGGRIYGCDTCQEVCPFNAEATPTTIAEFEPSERFMALTLDELATMTDDEWRLTFRGSAIKRAKAEGLRRNAERLLRDK